MCMDQDLNAPHTGRFINIFLMSTLMSKLSLQEPEKRFSGSVNEMSHDRSLEHHMKHLATCVSQPGDNDVKTCKVTPSNMLTNSNVTRLQGPGLDVSTIA